MNHQYPRTSDGASAFHRDIYYLHGMSLASQKWDHRALLSAKVHRFFVILYNDPVVMVLFYTTRRADIQKMKSLACIVCRIVMFGYYVPGTGTSGALEDS
eukprot:scaffold221552_cov62-Attheya_sp.AAC.1